MARVEIEVGRVPVCRWDYNPSTKYYLGNIVLYEDCAWISKQDNFIGQVPRRGSEYWDVFAAVGTTVAKVNTNNNFSTAQTVNGTLTVNGNIVQNGNAYVTETEHVKSKNSYVTVRDGAVGGLALNEHAGIEIKNYDGTNDGVIEISADGTLRVGDKDDTQPVLTRAEVNELQDGDLLMWDANNQKAVPLSVDIVDMEVTYEDDTTETFQVLCKQQTV